jgi:hypothetical protein
MSMEAVNHDLERFRAGDGDDAFFGLIDLQTDPIPGLTAAYRVEPDATVRAFIVHVLWQRRDPRTVGFLAEALNDPDPETWKQALDGLVALGNHQAKAALGVALAGAAERRAWIAEALTDWIELKEGST